MRIGIDVGGTFTDVVLLTSGRPMAIKVPTTPADPVRGALAGLLKALDGANVPPEAIRFIGHGTTIATNLLVERKGAKTALVTTRGFRDILEIRRASRHDRADLYDLFFTNPPPLVRRSLRLEIAERIRYDGTVECSLDANDVATLAERLATEDVEAVAICLINSPVEAAHEQELLRSLRERLPDKFICASCEVNPEINEYERTSTTVINAMLGPKCARYLRSFVAAVEETGSRAQMLFMRSNGGLATAAAAARLPVTLLESGPAGGVAAAVKLCDRIGVANAICGDMGGTTFDVSLVRGGRAEVRTGGEVDTYAVRAPTIDIESIGAGGGSIAWMDEGGGLHVGPRSAGADPGPACYGRGGNHPTVTDCNLILGYLDPESFLGGTFPLDREAAYRVIEDQLARPLGKSVFDAARSVRAIANASMAQAIRLMTVERGYDPREFAYLCYGGGGPVHAVELAAELGIPTVIVPRLPGLFSAFGMLVADQRYDAQLPFCRDIETLSVAELSDAIAQVDAALYGQLRRADVSRQHVRIERRADCRYSGQAESICVDLPASLESAGALALLREDFEHAHRRQWNFIQPDRPITIVNLRAQAVIATPAVNGLDGALERATAAAKPRRMRQVALAAELLPVAAFLRDDLRAGDTIAGPAIIEEGSSSIAFRAGDVCTVDGEGNLILSLGRNVHG